jgi:hypothetical protein
VVDVADEIEARIREPEREGRVVYTTSFGTCRLAWDRR